MRKMLSAAGALVLATVVFGTPAGAHDASELRDMLRDRGYYKIEFIVAEPPRFQVNACKSGERFHFHVDDYGKVTERSPLGSCGGYSNDDRSRRYRDPYARGSNRLPILSPVAVGSRLRSEGFYRIQLVSAQLPTYQFKAPRCFKWVV